MQVYIKTDKTGKLLESSLNLIEDAEVIEVTDEQFNLIQKQYDTYIENGIITIQEKGEDAINIENALISNKEENTDI